MVLKELIKIKKLITKVLCLSLLCCTFFNSFVSYSYGHSKHDLIMKKILFGNENKFFSGDKAKKMQALEYASYLCVDQFNGEGSYKLECLRKDMHITNIIKSIYEINYPNTFVDKENTHRRYTHQGWNYNGFRHLKIPNTDIFEDANWNKRKKILLETCKKVFDFDFQLVGYDKKCDAFCSLIYYIHLIGDYHEISESEDKYGNYKMNSDKHPYMIPLYKRNDSVNILNALEENFKTLFSKQKEDDNYKKLLSPSLSEISKIKDRLRLECSYNEFKEICNDLIKVLEENVPELLKREDFFRNVFY